MPLHLKPVLRINCFKVKYLISCAWVIWWIWLHSLHWNETCLLIKQQTSLSKQYNSWKYSHLVFSSNLIVSCTWHTWCWKLFTKIRRSNFLRSFGLSQPFNSTCTVSPMLIHHVIEFSVQVHTKTPNQSNLEKKTNKFTYTDTNNKQPSN